MKQDVLSFRDSIRTHAFRSQRIIILTTVPHVLWASKLIGRTLLRTTYNFYKNLASSRNDFKRHTTSFSQHDHNNPNLTALKKEYGSKSITYSHSLHRVFTKIALTISKKLKTDGVLPNETCFVVEDGAEVTVYATKVVTTALGLLLVLVGLSF